VFLAGRTRETLDGVAAEIEAEDEGAHVAGVDALDDAAVNEHVQAVVDQGGTVDVRFNLISRGDLQGTPLLEMDVEDFMPPISVGARSDFVTARAAARHIGAPAVGGDPDDLERIRRGTQGLARLSDG
jgi:NAD(P)-dependent dehydrogenase (short-subunit alcohol dehydrogenase family)